jgi:NDP-hexose 2,3-enoyl reductase
VQYTFLGKTGMKVSRLCLGTMNFAWQTSEQDSGESVSNIFSQEGESRE